jgi:hypothetical protein
VARLIRAYIRATIVFDSLRVDILGKCCLKFELYICINIPAAASLMFYLCFIVLFYAIIGSIRGISKSLFTCLFIDRLLFLCACLVVINGSYPNQKLSGFMLVAVPLHARDETTAMGTFQVCC